MSRPQTRDPETKRIPISELPNFEGISITEDGDPPGSPPPVVEIEEIKDILPE